MIEAIDDKRLLPHPVVLRDVMARTALTPAERIEMHRLFQDYIRHYGLTETLAREMLVRLINAGG